MADLPVLAGLA
ncbi:hypothetical protein YPPY56_4672, partial [Yersinia pestis PY-56]